MFVNLVKSFNKVPSIFVLDSFSKTVIYLKILFTEFPPSSLSHVIKKCTLTGNVVQMNTKIMEISIVNRIFCTYAKL